MAKRGDSEVLKYVVRFLRFHAGRKSQDEFGSKSGVSQSDLSDYEAGKKSPPEAALRRMAIAAGVEWPLVVHARRFYSALVSAIRHGVAAVVPAQVTFDIAQLAVGPEGLARGSAAMVQQQPAAALKMADEVWEALVPLPLPERRRLLGFSLRAPQNWALALRVCAASLRAAADRADEALALAELALKIAEGVPGFGHFRKALQGLCWCHIGNARRVANDFVVADRAFATADDLWRQGADPDGLLPEWLRFALEAALRCEQHLFTRAAELLTRAFEASGENKVAAAMVLLEKERVFDLMGDFEGALAVLAEAAPFVEGSQEPHLQLSLQFKRARNLCYLGRYRLAAALLPGIRDFAERQENELDLIRLNWLEAKTFAGLGQAQVAIARLEQVQRDFTVRKLPYDAALSSLDLAVLWLEAGRAAEVRELAVGMAWIFSAQGIHREALASLRLFADAARHDKATTGLARQVIAEIEKVRRTAPPLPKKEGRKA